MKLPRSEGRMRETRRDPTRNRLRSFHAGVKYKNSRTELQAQSGCFYVESVLISVTLNPAQRARDSNPQAPSSFCGGLKGGTWQTQVKQAYSESGNASLPDSRFLDAAHGGLRWGCHPKPCLGISSPNPIFASRRFKGGDLANAGKTGLVRVRERFAP